MKDKICIDGVTYVREESENVHSAASKCYYKAMPQIKRELSVIDVYLTEYAENIIGGHILGVFQEGAKWAQEQTKKG